MTFVGRLTSCLSKQGLTRQSCWQADRQRGFPPQLSFSCPSPNLTPPVGPPVQTGMAGNYLEGLKNCNVVANDDCAMQTTTLKDTQDWTDKRKTNYIVGSPTSSAKKQSNCVQNWREPLKFNKRTCIYFYDQMDGGPHLCLTCEPLDPYLQHRGPS